MRAASTLSTKRVGRVHAYQARLCTGPMSFAFNFGGDSADSAAAEGGIPVDATGPRQGDANLCKTPVSRPAECIACFHEGLERHFDLVRVPLLPSVLTCFFSKKLLSRASRILTLRNAYPWVLVYMMTTIVFSYYLYTRFLGDTWIAAENHTCPE